jgi:PKD repeat protein
VGSSVTFTSTSGPDPLFFTWNFGDGTEPVSAGVTVSHTFTSAGKRSVFLIVSNGFCADTVIREIEVLNDCVSLNLTASFELSADTIDLNDQGSVTALNTSTNATEFFWDFGNGKSESSTVATNVTSSYPQTGTYTIKLVARNYNCVDSTTRQLVVIQVDDTTGQTTSLIDRTKLEWSVYPNPVADWLTVSLLHPPTGDVSNLHLSLMDPLGRIILTEPFAGNETRKCLSMNGLPSGIYHLRLSDGIRSVSTTCIKN